VWCATPGTRLGAFVFVLGLKVRTPVLPWRVESFRLG
jgi:hypothetical protein